MRGRVGKKDRESENWRDRVRDEEKNLVQPKDKEEIELALISWNI